MYPHTDSFKLLRRPVFWPLTVSSFNFSPLFILNFIYFTDIWTTCCIQFTSNHFTHIYLCVLKCFIFCSNLLLLLSSFFSLIPTHLSRFNSGVISSAVFLNLPGSTSLCSILACFCCPFIVMCYSCLHSDLLIAGVHVLPYLNLFVSNILIWALHIENI